MRKAILIPFVFGISLAVVGVLWAGAAEPAPQAPAADPQFGGRNMELVSQWWGTFAAVEISGTYAYLTQGQRLSIFDISDPGNIDLVAQSEVLTNHSENLRVSGDYAFLADPGIYAYGQEAGSRLHVMDISDPAAPYEVAYLENDGNRAWDIELYNGFAFLADELNLWVVDVSDPLNPTSVKRMNLAGGE